MAEKRLYICDGDIPECNKSFCGFNGNGNCTHTADEGHARYNPPRDWSRLWVSGNLVFFEKERPLDGR